MLCFWKCSPPITYIRMVEAGTGEEMLTSMQISGPETNLWIGNCNIPSIILHGTFENHCSRAVISNPGWFCPCGDTGQCLETSWRGGTTTTKWWEVKDAANILELTGLPLAPRVIQPQMSTVLRLRHFAICMPSNSIVQRWQWRWDSSILFEFKNPA